MFHLGKLSEHLCKYPQPWGTCGLITNIVEGDMIMTASDVYLDMGHVVLSLLYAYESLNVDGKTPRNLEKIIIGNYFNHNLISSQQCIDVLKKSIVQRKKAFILEENIKNNTLDKNPEYSHIVDNMPVNEHFLNLDYINDELELLLKKNKKNKMAFEYLLTNNLLSLKLADFIHNLDDNEYINYSRIPTTYQEAIILYYFLKKDRNGLSERPIEQYAFDNFTYFNNAVKGYDHEKTKSQAIHFKKTFWYYARFNEKKTSEEKIKAIYSNKRIYFD
jgi:hypothetical protein